MTGLHNYQSSLQQEHHQHYLGQLDNNQPVMDELLEQIFSIPSWSDVGGGSSKVPWDYHMGGSGANPNLDSSGALQGAQKLFTMSLLPPGLLSGAFSDQGLGSQQRQNQEVAENQQLGENTQYCNGNVDVVSHLQQQQEIQGLGHAPVGGPVGSLAFDDNRTLNLVSQAMGSSRGGLRVHPVSPLPPLRLMNGTGSLRFHSSSSMVSNGSPLPVLTPGSNLENLTLLTQSPSGRSSGSEGSAEARSCQSPPSTAPIFQQPCVGSALALPFALGQNKPENILETSEAASGEAPFLGKRSRNDDASLKEPIANQGRHGLFNTLAGGQVGVGQLGRTTGQLPSQDNLAVTEDIVSPTYWNATAAAQAHAPGQAVPVTDTNGARPRVRARRGQATDPHSIAERLRRERIAERMKSLQGLVPNSNKTDKASMLDEIIDYVKFLQLQVKVLSMSRLGGAGVVAQVMNDLPSEGPSNLLAATLGQSNVNSGPSPEGLSLTEHQVARLMEEDMGTAMQYLQSKGLCLMPISLASAISSTGAKSKAINEGASGVISDDKTQAVTVSMSSSLAVVGRAPSCTGGVSDDWKISDSGSGTKVGNEGIRQVKGSTELNHEEMSNAFGDAKASESPINGAQNSS